MEPQVRNFGYTKNGEDVGMITITDGGRCYAELLSFGAAVRSLYVPNEQGDLLDVCLGYDTLQEYEDGNSCFGATMGRCVDRIAGASFTLSGKQYPLSENRQGFHIHGGFQGFHKKAWQYELHENAAVFTYRSPDGEEGYPGQVIARVTYQFAARGTLQMSYEALCDRETVVNLTNHSYFNLDGHSSGSALEETLCIPSELYAKVGANNIPTGEIISAAGTPLDFRIPQKVGEHIDADYPALRQVGGYDHCFLLEEGWKEAARLRGAHSGICMSVYTDFPVLHLYTANFLANQRGKGKAIYDKHHGICVETEYLPNAVNLGSVKDKPVFSPTHPFVHKTQYRFTCDHE